MAGIFEFTITPKSGIAPAKMQCATAKEGRRTRREPLRQAGRKGRIEQAGLRVRLLRLIPIKVAVTGGAIEAATVSSGANGCGMSAPSSLSSTFTG